LSLWITGQPEPESRLSNSFMPIHDRLPKSSLLWTVTTMSGVTRWDLSQDSTQRWKQRPFVQGRCR
jgi:hypothetical protein